MDLHRLWIGQAPASFLVEVAIRAIIVYAALVVAIRLMGKRTVSQLSLSELALVVTLGAAVGVPMQVPEHGMLPGVIVLAVAIVFQRGVHWVSFRSRRVARLIEGDAVILLRDDVLDLAAMRRNSLPRENLFAVLRASGIEQLGQVRRIYLESSGNFSIWMATSTVPGLSIVPNGDPEIRELEGKVSGHWACQMCGTVVEGERVPAERCRRCGQRNWTTAGSQTETGLAEEPARRHRLNESDSRRAAHGEPGERRPAGDGSSRSGAPPDSQ